MGTPQPPHDLLKPCVSFPPPSPTDPYQPTQSKKNPQGLGNPGEQKEAERSPGSGAGCCLVPTGRAGQEAAEATLESTSHPDQPGPSLGTVAKLPSPTLGFEETETLWCNWEG